MKPQQDQKPPRGPHWQAAADCDACSGATLEKMIASRAYQIWQSQGCPRGTELKNWLQAEAELKATHALRVGKRSGRRPAESLEIDPVFDLVDEAADESFPASDPPSWTHAACS